MAGAAVVVLGDEAAIWLDTVRMCVWARETIGKNKICELISQTDCHTNK